MIELERLDPFRLRLQPEGKRLIPATVYLPEGIAPESEAIKQLADVTTIDAGGVALATPDIHVGYGVPIGSVFGSERYVSPAAVGYDVNCGMRLLTTPLAITDVDVVTLAGSIRRDIPLGEGMSNVTVSARSLGRLVAGGVPAMAELVEHEPELARTFIAGDFADDRQRIEDLGAMRGDEVAVPDRAIERGRNQLGTLGGGNHFIELQRVERVDDPEIGRRWGLREGQLVIMLHSGSRGFGHEVGGHFMKLAQTYCSRHQLVTPSKDLAYLPLDSSEGKAYLGAMQAADNFAFINRQIMAALVRRNLRHYHGAELPVPTLYDVPHNIAKFERVGRRELCVHRKGATRAYPASLMQGTPYSETGQPVLIPGSMGTASYVLAGVESGAESLYSVNHGAGRVMSRTAAAGVVKRGKVIKQGQITDAEFKESMKGVHLICADRAHIKEEAPAAYKDIDAVIETVVGAGLARVVARLVPLAVLKG
jgi:tRNA-splicing ligase RtcB (3'-phosphate/5'-hydroxy nucleic acid ligase)